MRKAADLADYAYSPVGKYWTGNGFLHLCAAPNLFATFIFGRPTELDAQAMVRALAIEMAEETAPHASYADARFLEWIDPVAFGVLAKHFEATRAQSARKITAQAMVHEGGLVGSTTAGYFLAFRPAFPYQAFHDPIAAAKWLGVSQTALQEWEELLLPLRTQPAEIRLLRDWLATNIEEAEIERAAKALALSVRTMQRHLEALGTSFLAELDHVRFEIARTQLLSSDTKLISVALSCGFKTPQHFADWFRKQTGVSPSDYRKNSGAK